MQSGYVIREVVSRKDNNHWGTLPAVPFHLLPLAISTSGEMGSNVQMLIRALAETKVDECRYFEDEEGRKAGAGREGESIQRWL